MRTFLCMVFQIRKCVFNVFSKMCTSKLSDEAKHSVPFAAGGFIYLLLFFWNSRSVTPGNYSITLASPKPLRL